MMIENQTLDNESFSIFVLIEAPTAKLSRMIYNFLRVAIHPINVILLEGERKVEFLWTENLRPQFLIKVLLAKLQISKSLGFEVTFNKIPTLWN